VRRFQGRNVPQLRDSHGHATCERYALSGSSGSNDGDERPAPLCTSAYTDGNTISVANVAATRPTVRQRVQRRPRIWTSSTRFFTTKGDKGSGLGLAISKELIERVGGAIRVESAPNAGATFTLDLPEATEAS
jgi:hypothetical protein